MKLIYSTLVIAVLIGSCDQKAPLAKLPIPISNNAVVAITIKGEDFVYSFGGIGPSKESSDITLRSFRYAIGANTWTEIDPLPDTMPKIAAAASVVKGLIYIIGGYHVFPDGHEKSSAKVHIYDPGREEFLDNGPDLLTPIDDHVQAVWQDSLIYVATGWSDSLNVNLVQVYDPGGHWHYASPLPEDNPHYQVFGSSGVIVENTLYFLGGAGNRVEGNFPVQSSLKIGQINPENPLEIRWQVKADSLAARYRPGAVVSNGRPYWIGGSKKSYNYNGIAYTGEAVNGVTEAVYYDPQRKELFSEKLKTEQIMDLRGIGQLSTEGLMIVGGMLPGQVVSDQIVMVRK